MFFFVLSATFISCFFLFAEEFDFVLSLEDNCNVQADATDWRHVAIYI